ncbi:hypothetical protein TNCV_3138311 [Trichonephila clavipes]|nr:hypothetical protein TNCV_3138311 [Trichonephila clavipes]
MVHFLSTLAAHPIVKTPKDPLRSLQISYPSGCGPIPFHPSNLGMKRTEPDRIKSSRTFRSERQNNCSRDPGDYTKMSLVQKLVGVAKGTTCTVLAGNETFEFHPFEPTSETGDPALLPKAHNGLDTGEIKLSPDEMILKYRNIVYEMIDDSFIPNVKTCIACEPCFSDGGTLPSYPRNIEGYNPLHVLIVKRCPNFINFHPTSP